jgi:polysaccharide biosynthesis protein PslH
MSNSGNDGSPATGDLRGGSSRPLCQPGDIVFLTDDLGEQAFGGGTLRNRALAMAIKDVDPTSTVVEASAIQKEIGCAQRCADCADVTVNVDGTPLRDPYAWNYCQRACAYLRDLLRRGATSSVIVSNIQLYRYLEAILDAGVKNVALDMHNSETDLRLEIAARPREAALRIGPPVEIPAVGMIENHISTKASVITFVSELDRARFTARCSPAATAVIPNAVDVGQLSPSAQRARPDLLFLGALDYFPNIEAAIFLLDEVFPAIRQAIPEATLTVAGREPHPYLSRWSGAPGVHLIANPIEATPFLHERILVVPLQVGGGSRLKILEAFAVGSPVVSTTKGAEGLDILPDVHYLAADTDPGSYVNRLRELIDRPDEDARRRAAAFDLVRRNYSWSSLRGPVSNAIELLTR